jgi:hypothetical protein
MAHTHEEDMDFSGIVNRYSDMRRERDTLRSQLTDVERSFAVSESKVERLESELEKTKAQLDSIKAALVEKQTVIESIGATIINHMKKHEPIPHLPQVSTFRPRPSEHTLRTIAESIGQREPPREIAGGGERESNE